MVHARLHLICGNCGCGDAWEWQHKEKEEDDGEVMTDEDVFITCLNCATLHSLNSKAKNRKP